MAPGLVAHVCAPFDAPAVGSSDEFVLVTAKALGMIRTLLADHNEVNATGSTLRRGRDHRVDHEVTPVLPADILAAALTTSGNIREGLAPDGPHESLMRESFLGKVIDERAVIREDIRIVVTVVCTGIDRVCIAIHELLDLIVIERGQSRLVRSDLLGDDDAETQKEQAPRCEEYESSASHLRPPKLPYELASMIHHVGGESRSRTD
jgi:hypothetical protein